MDIVKTLSFIHLKASFQTLKLKQKFFLLVFLLSLFLNLIPHETYAFQIKAPTASQAILVFDMNDKSYQDVIDSWNTILSNDYNHEKTRAQAVRQGQLTVKVTQYLKEQNSPLANYSQVLTSVKNWKQIVALANAESSLCRNYPVTKANCWGVGGASLWDFGNNLGDGILAMNQFLAKYPLRSPLKYSQMTFKQMNGLYKQPAAAHWLYNAQSTYDDLSVIEKSL